MSAVSTSFYTKPHSQDPGTVLASTDVQYELRGSSRDFDLMPNYDFDFSSSSYIWYDASQREDVSIISKHFFFFQKLFARIILSKTSIFRLS